MRMLATTLTALSATAVLSVAALAEDAPLAIDGATTVDADAVIELVTTTPDLIILDNRREGDFAAGHIEGAVRLLDDDIGSADDIAAHVPSTDTPVLFYCNGLSCGRAANAAEMAIGWGYSEVYYYALGMDEWRERGLPLITE
jgi:rhodanese-related sulfurtransferase